jgi:hypothetical protein
MPRNSEDPMYETENDAAKPKAADSVVTAAKEKAGELAEPLKDKALEIAEPLKDKALEVAKEQKDAGADQLRLLARAIRSASEAVQPDVPRVANYMKSLSGKLDRASSDIRESELDELGRSASDFAKRNPALVFGGAMLAGLALSRFLKSSHFNSQNRYGDGQAMSGAA